MDRTEKLAEDYLKDQGYDPVFEPLGHSTCPDFEINKVTAVEVRRLNENKFQKERLEGLNVKSRQITDLVETTFKEFTSKSPSKNYWVGLRFWRPLGKTKEIKKQLRKKLSILIDNSNIGPDEVAITDSIKLQLIPKEHIENQIFHLGTISDRDSGGWVIPNLLENLEYCMKDKIKKVQGSKKEYESWWLILIDEISYGLKEEDQAYIISKIEKDPIFNKVILLNTLNGKEILKI